MSLIYCLYATDDGCPRYVGQTTKAVRVRLAQHLRDAGYGGTTVSNWIRVTMAAGLQIRAHILQSPVAPGDLNLFERYWIGQFAGLLNSNRALPGPRAHSKVGHAVMEALRSGLMDAV